MRKILGGFCVLLTLAACGTSPEPDYLLLQPVPGAVVTDFTDSVKIDRPTLPEYLDRLDIVRQTDNDHVAIDESRRWAAPLDSLFEDVLAADMRQRLPGAVVVTEHDNVTDKTRFVVNTDIANLNDTDSGSVLTAQLLMKDMSTCVSAQPQALPFHAVAASGPDGLSALIGEAADRITSALRQQPTQAATCDPSHPCPCPNQVDPRR